MSRHSDIISSKTMNTIYKKKSVHFLNLGNIYSFIMKDNFFLTDSFSKRNEERINRLTFVHQI